MEHILLNETQKLRAAREEPEFLDSDYDAKNLYQVDKISLEDTKKNLTDVSVRLNTNRTIHMGLKIEMI